MFDYKLVGALGVTWWLIWLIRYSMKCQRIDDLSTFFSVPSHRGSFHQQWGSHFHQDKEERGNNALPPLPISAQDPAISINRAFALLHTKLARISDSSIPHMHAFTCRCRHLSPSASPLPPWYTGPKCPPFRSTLRGDTGWRLLPAERSHCFQPPGLL